ncbi:hypothetical protein [Uliginosibacterium gangwonense]|nr:hypothetical protein [Uliginosibacterium gangwonense]
MSHKEQHGNKETKKTPVMGLKEKRLVKAAKRHSKTIQQLFPSSQ